MDINTSAFDLDYFVLAGGCRATAFKCLVSLEYAVTLREKSEHQ